MFIARIINDLAVRRRRRRDSLTLAALSNSQLKDIGIARHELFDPNSYR